MKKLLALLLALVMVLALAACGGETAEPTEPDQTTAAPETTEATEEQSEETETKGSPELVSVMSHEEFMAAEEETQVVIECAVQGHQSWWDNKISVYAADENGGYYLYELACSEEDAAKLTEGTWIRVTGVKKSWEGMVEVMDATFEFIDRESYVAEVQDFTDLLGTEELVNKTALPGNFQGMTVESIEFKGGEPGDDIYLTVKYNEETYSFCIEMYLTGPDTDVYKTASELEVGDVIDVVAFVYWYQGVQPHITSLIVVE